MIEITSTTNNLVKETAKLAQKKFRNQTGLFLLEGQKAVEEALPNVKFEQLFVLKEKAEKYTTLTQGQNVVIVNDAVMGKIATTESVPEILAVAQQVKYTINDIKQKNKIVLLENIKDNGNLGTIIRTCAAFGVEAIILAGESADIYNPKTVRAATGNLFKTPFVYCSSAYEAKKNLNNHTFYGTVVSGDAKSIVGLELDEKSVIMFGSEAHGLSESAIQAVDIKITIPISKNVESLNLSTAVTICIWELLGK